MIKRVVWWGVGAAMGIVGSQWAQHRVKRRVAQVVQKYAPPAVAKRVKANTKVRTLTVVDGVRGAIDTGKAAAGAREQELRDRFGRGDQPIRKRR
jgi:hypothetical protein